MRAWIGGPGTIQGRGLIVEIVVLRRSLARWYPRRPGSLRWVVALRARGGLAPYRAGDHQE